MNDGSIDGGKPARPMLFQPLMIRGLTLKNRLVVPPMVNYRCDPGNTCGSFHTVHLGRYALGGFGLVFVEATAIEEVFSEPVPAPVPRKLGRPRVVPKRRLPGDVA